MAFDEVNLKYQSPMQREAEATPKRTLRLSPFNLQRILTELIVQHWSYNDPSVNGYTFDDRYNPADSSSGVIIDMAYNQKFSVASKRPGIFIARYDASYGSPVMGQTINVKPEESEKTKLHIVNMNLSVNCIASPVALAEQIAEWSAQPLIDYEEQIRDDFRLRRFRMDGIAKPTVYQESKDGFLVQLQVSTVFDCNVLIQEDNLKLKTISRSIFLGLNNQPLPNQ